MRPVRIELGVHLTSALVLELLAGADDLHATVSWMKRTLATPTGGLRVNSLSMVGEKEWALPRLARFRPEKRVDARARTFPSKVSCPHPGLVRDTLIFSSLNLLSDTCRWNGFLATKFQDGISAREDGEQDKTSEPEGKRLLRSQSRWHRCSEYCSPKRAIKLELCCASSSR